MRFADVLGLAIESLRLHRLRTGLSTAAVAIGVTAVLLLTTLGDAAKGYVVAQFASFGSNLVIVMPGRTETFGATTSVDAGTRDLTIADGEAVRRRSPAAAVAVPVALGNAGVEYEGRRRDVYVIGTTAEYAPLRGLRIAAGSFLPAGDAQRGERVVVIGSRLRRELFAGENPLGARVRIGEAPFRVIGALESQGRTMGVDMDDLAVIPVATALPLFGESTLHRLMLQARDVTAVPRLVADARAIITDRHRDEDFTIVTQDALLTSFRAILDALTAALAAIAAISLAVAGIGIMNVMLVAVSERVGEVGLLKALGARRRQVAQLFLAEAVLLTGLGATIGIALGLALIAVASRLWPALPFAASPVWIALVLGLALAAGAAFGVWPARRASALPAVEALRRKP
jgi:putative ABC transport system permease protein